MSKDKLTTDETLTSVQVDVELLHSRIKDQHNALMNALPYVRTALDSACLHYESTGENFGQVADVEDLVSEIERLIKN